MASRASSSGSPIPDPRQLPILEAARAPTVVNVEQVRVDPVEAAARWEQFDDLLWAIVADGERRSAGSNGGDDIMTSGPQLGGPET